MQNVECPTRNVQCPSVRCIPSTFDIPCWTFDILHFCPLTQVLKSNNSSCSSHSSVTLFIKTPLAGESLPCNRQNDHYEKPLYVNRLGSFDKHVRSNPDQRVSCQCS